MSQPVPPAQSDPSANAPAGPHPSMPRPEPVTKHSWFARHKILTSLGALVVLVVVLVVVASAANGGSKASPAAGAHQTAATGTQAPAAPAQPPAHAQPPAPAEPAAAAAAGIGTAVRDGKFEFTVTAIDPGVASVGSDAFGQKAQGQFVLVHLTIQNIGDKAQYFDGSSQKAFDAQGREFSADTGAAIYLKDANSFLNEINPGNTVTGTVVFDMPPGATIAKLELHDSPFSGGVNVTP